MNKRKIIRTICLLYATLIAGASFAQMQNDIPKNIPPFNIVLSDGVTYYNRSNLEKGKPLMVVYFSPECGHCQELTKQLVKNISRFNNKQIVMICSVPGLPPLKKFVSDFELNKYKNIKVGTEGIYRATMNFYHVFVTPFIALYNSNGTLVTYYRNMPPIQDVIKRLNDE